MFSTNPGGLLLPFSKRSYGAGWDGVGGEVLIMEIPSIEGPTSEIGLESSEGFTDSRIACIRGSAIGETEFESRNSPLSSSICPSSSRTPKSRDSTLGSPLTLENGENSGKSTIWLGKR